MFLRWNSLFGNHAGDHRRWNRLVGWIAAGFFFFNDTATTEIYNLSLHDALPISRLREHFDDAQLVELTHLIAVENMRGRFNLALGIGAAGFSEGMVCAVPATTS